MAPPWLLCLMSLAGSSPLLWFIAHPACCRSSSAPRQGCRLKSLLLSKKRASSSRAQPSNLIFPFSAGLLSPASFHSWCATGYLAFVLHTVGFVFSSNRECHYPGRCLCASVFWLHQFSIQFLVKMKPSLQWENRAKNWCSYSLGLDKERGQITNRVVVS